jgi:cell division protein FtsW
VIEALRPSPASAPSPQSLDRTLFGVLFVLMLLGLLLVQSTSAAISLDRFGTTDHYVARHLVHLAIGACALVALWRTDYRILDRSAVVHGLWAVVIVLLVLCFFEDPAGGARRWVRFGALSFQPSELAKLAVVLAGAFQLSRRADRLEDPWRGLLPPLVITGWVALLVALQPDFGASAELLALLLLLALVAGTPWRVLGGFAAAGGGLLAVYLVQEPYRLTRLKAFLSPGADPLGSGFQLNQSLIALGTGGWTGRSSDGLLGTGFGTSLQKLFFLPEPHTDFPFAVLGEELGIAGTLAVVALFAAVLVLGFRVAASADTAFGTLLATGATAVISLQALLNVGVVVGLLPTKGVALPFLSAGGSSLVVSCAAAGLLLSVARHGHAAEQVGSDPIFPAGSRNIGRLRKMGSDPTSRLREVTP